MQAFWAIFLGMGSLFLITSFLGIAAQKTGLNLSLLSRYSYGSKGFVVPMIVMALLTLGWFASILGMIGDIWGAFIGNPSGIIVFDPVKFGFEGIAPITLEVFLLCIIWGAVFTFTAIKGMGANQLPRCKHSSTVSGSYVASHSTCLLHLLTQVQKRGMKVSLSLPLHIIE